MSMVVRSIQFLKRYIFTSPRYAVAYLLIFWQKNFRFQTPFLSEKDLVEKIKNGKSINRLGDGEINLMIGQKNHYQTFSPVLQKSMFDIVESYDKESSYILSVPRFINYTNRELRDIGKFYVWLPLKAVFWLYFKKTVPYLDAHAFYYDGYFERTIGPVLLDKHIILITRQDTIDKQKNNARIPWSRISYLATPAEEALDSSASIKQQIDQLLIATEIEQTVLLFAMGPVGKYLAYQYAQKGVQSLDVGKVAELMYTNESIGWMV